MKGLWIFIQDCKGVKLNGMPVTVADFVFPDKALGFEVKKATT